MLVLALFWPCVGLELLLKVNLILVLTTSTLIVPERFRTLYKVSFSKTWTFWCWSYLKENTKQTVSECYSFLFTSSRFLFFSTHEGKHSKFDNVHHKEREETRHLISVSVLVFGSCHLILFVRSTNYFQIVRRQCCKREEEKSSHGFVILHNELSLEFCHADYDDVTFELLWQMVANWKYQIRFQDFSFNWDYIQSCFFSLTILTTIGEFLVKAKSSAITSK